MPPETMEEEGEAVHAGPGSPGAPRRRGRGREPRGGPARRRPAARHLRGRRRGARRSRRGAHRARRVPPGRRDHQRGGQGRDQRPLRPVARRHRVAAIAGAQSPAPGRRHPRRGHPLRARRAQGRAAGHPHRHRSRRDRPQPPEDAWASSATPAPPSRPWWRASARPPRRASSRKAEHEALRAETAALAQEPQGSIVKSLRAGTPENAILVAGHDPDRLLLAPVLADVRGADLSVVLVLGQSRLRVSGGARRQGRLPQPAGDRGDRGRRLHVQRPGARHRRAAEDQRGGGGVQRQRLRQCGPRPGRVVGRAPTAPPCTTPTS